MPRTMHRAIAQSDFILPKHIYRHADPKIGARQYRIDIVDTLCRST